MKAWKLIICITVGCLLGNIWFWVLTLIPKYPAIGTIHAIVGGLGLVFLLIWFLSAKGIPSEHSRN